MRPAIVNNVSRQESVPSTQRSNSEIALELEIRNRVNTNRQINPPGTEIYTHSRLIGESPSLSRRRIEEMRKKDGEHHSQVSLHSQSCRRWAQETSVCASVAPWTGATRRGAEVSSFSQHSWRECHQLTHIPYESASNATRRHTEVTSFSQHSRRECHWWSHVPYEPTGNAP